MIRLRSILFGVVAVSSLIATSVLAGTPIAINTGQHLWCTPPSIASVDPTRLVTIWACSSQVDDDFKGNFGRLLAYTGRPTGPIFRIGDMSTPNPFNSHPTPDIASLPDGGFVVAWRERPGNGSWQTKAQRFDVAGRPRETAVVLPTVPIWPTWAVKIAAGETGDVFVATYQRLSSVIQVYRFEFSNGIRRTSFTVDVNRVDQAFKLVDLEIGPGNRPVVIWTRSNPGTRGAHNEINGASFEADGTPIDHFSLENHNPYCSPRNPAAASGPDSVTLIWTFDGLCGPEDSSIWGVGFDRMGTVVSRDPIVVSNERGTTHDIALRVDGSPVLAWSRVDWIRGSGPSGLSGPVTIAENVDADDLRLAGDDRHGYVVVWWEREGTRDSLFAAPFAPRATRNGSLRAHHSP